MPAIVVSATFTAEPVAGVLSYWIRELGWDFQVRFAPYNQVFQQLLDPESLLATNRNGIDVVLVRLEDWAPLGKPAALEENVRTFIGGLRAATATFHSPILVAVCPPSPGFAHAAAMEALLGEQLHAFANTHLATLAELQVLYPVRDYYDPHADKLGKLPYTPAMFAAIATLLVRKIHALRMAPYKVIALDCDDTLWQGVVGEDGPDGVRLDAPRRALQEFMLGRRDAGMLLALCSKNNEDDVVEAFRLHPDWPLRLEHFTARRINWAPKSANLVSLADELKLGLDTFLVVDDNPAECAELQAHCPDAQTITLPAAPEKIPAFLRHVWAFDRLRATEEDRRRAALYAQEAERGRLEKKSASLQEFLDALKLEVRIAPATHGQLTRVAQLTQRTNQMNFTGIRRGEAELQQALRDGAECLTVDVEDRFGSYGLVGVIIYRPSEGALAVDSFLLSCRALGRGVEHRMLARLGEIARSRGLAIVEARLVPLPRNSPAYNLLESVGAQFAHHGESGTLYRFPAEYLASVAYRPNGQARRPDAAQPRPAAAAIRESIDYNRIANELSDPEQVLRAATPRPAPTAASNGSGQPRTDLERRLAALWAELLGAPAVGIHDNFFDLGGHSLLAVQLLSRVRQEFHVDLSLEVVYGGPFTVAELAKAIDLQQIEQAGTADYNAILQELENLSDEEVRALLAQEQSDDE